MINRGSSDERLTNVDTSACNCYTCKVAHYLAPREALLRALMYDLVIKSQVDAHLLLGNGVLGLQP